MKVLVAGATGYIGVRVVRKLTERGHEVVALSRSGGQPWPDLQRTVQVARGDVTAIDELLDAIRRHRVARIINLAYPLTPVIDANPQLGLKIGVMGMNNVFEASRLMDIERVVYSSSLFYYGRQSSFGERCLVEEDEPRPTTIIGSMNLINELMSRKFQQNYDTSIVALRVPVVYGHGRSSANRQAWATDFASDPAIGKPAFFPYAPDAKACMVHLDDVAEMFVLACLAEEVQRDAYNTGGHTCTLRELGDIVKDFIPDARLVYDEKTPYGGLRYIDEMVYLMDGNRLSSEFGFVQRDLRQGILDHINAARAAANLPPIYTDR